MTTRLEPHAPASLVQSRPSAGRTTSQPTRPFQSVMSAGADAVVTGAEAAVRHLPGGPILAAAFHPASGNQPGAPPVAVTPEGYPAGTAATGPSGTPGSASSDPALEGVIDQNSDKNLYYIALQEKISAENRLYSAYSNVLRVRHETMKNAIGNVR